MFLCDFIDEVSSFCNIHGETVDKSCFPGLSSYLGSIMCGSDSVGGPASDRGDEVDIGIMIMKSKSLFSEGELRSVLCSVATGLQYIQSKQLVHLNIKE